MGILSVEASEARRNYQREYNIKNRERINSQRKNWRAKNRDKVQQYNRKYWERRAEKSKNIRASYQDYGITSERLNELMEIVKSGRYDALVRSAAHTANKDIAEYILLSVTKDKSYDELKKKWELREIERMACGRSDFYGYRRLFFHYLDCTLKSGKAD